MIHLPVAVADSVENQGLDLVKVVGILTKHPEIFPDDVNRFG
jgi:hypothetical protein